MSKNLDLKIDLAISQLNIFLGLTEGLLYIYSKKKYYYFI